MAGSLASRGLIWGTFVPLLLALAGANEARAEGPGAQLLESYVAAWNSGDVESLDSILAEGFARHGNYGSAASRLELKRLVTSFRGYYRDLHITIDDAFANETGGAMRWRFTGGWGETSFEIESVNFSMFRLSEGKISEEWVVGNTTDFWVSMGYTIMPPGTTMIPPAVEAPSEPAPRPHRGFEELAAFTERQARDAPARSGRLEIASDIDCQLVLDGQAIGWIEAGRVVTLPLARGEHGLRASSLAGSIVHRERFSIKKDSTTRLEITAPSRIVIQPLKRTAEDLTTGLMWQMTDNGANISQRASDALCRDLSHGGYTDWRLPTIFELEGLYDPATADSKRFHTIPGITLTGCCPWTSTPRGDFHWTFVFYNGLRYIKHGSIAKFSRALCVRDALAAPAHNE